MSLTIGRAVIAEDPEYVRQSGDRVEFVGDIDPTSVDEMKAIRQQLLGLVDNDDEQVFPLIWSEDSSHDGFYDVVGVDVEPYTTHLTTGLLRYRVELDRIPNFANPRFEQITSAVVRPNGHSITSAVCNAGAVLVGDAAGFDYSSTETSFLTRGGSSLAEQLYVFTDTAPFTNARVGWRATPATHYTLGCLIEQKRNGTWYPVVGRSVDWDSAEWRISNGLFMVTPNTSDTNDLDVSIRQFSPAQWETTTFEYGYQGSVSFSGGSFLSADPGDTSALYPGRPYILRNSPERVVIACDGITGYRHTLSLTAGDHHCVLRHTGSVSDNWGAQFASTVATSDMPTAAVGIRRTADNADGNREVIMHSGTATNDNVRGLSYRTANVSSTTLGIGVVKGGGSAPAGDQAADLTAQFFGATTVRRRVVSR
jgi:hypothetical protein